jgi:hypothetical protein
MKNNTLTPRQLMLSPNVLAYELGQIPTPEKIENSNNFLMDLIYFYNICHQYYYFFDY